MKKLLMTITLASMVPGAQAAIYCETEAQCFTKALSLVKRATKAGCKAEAQSIVDALGADSRVPGGVVEAAEICIEKAKSRTRREKAAAKRLERIRKALEAK